MPRTEVCKASTPNPKPSPEFIRRYAQLEKRFEAIKSAVINKALGLKPKQADPNAVFDDMWGFTKQQQEVEKSAFYEDDPNSVFDDVFDWQTDRQMMRKDAFDEEDDLRNGRYIEDDDNENAVLNDAFPGIFKLQK